jgi:hypothetical protein
MRKIYQSGFIALLSFLCFSYSALAQNNFFTDQGKNSVMPTNATRVITPVSYSASALDVTAMKNFLWSLPSEENFKTSRNNAPVLTLPMPDGSFARFNVWESNVMAPGLKVKFADIKTFAGQGIDDPAAVIHFDYNPYFGFRAQILSPDGRIYIDPYAKWDVNNYISYYHKDNHRNPGFSCGFDELEPSIRNSVQQRTNAGPCLGTQLRTYRFAVTCTGEYSQVVGGGNVAATLAEIVTATNRVSGVYEVDLSIRLQLVANNTDIIFTNATTDPWANDGSITELNQITGVINANLTGGAASYDIGHLFCTASNAGVAGLSVVCGASKGRGLTGGLNPVGDGYYIDYVAHEVGHQFSGQHSFNSNNCASPGGSYEPGSGTTVMAYAGICSATENIQPNSDPIFHAISFDQIGNFVTAGGGAACPVITATGNTLPVINPLPNNNLSIPINTPFVLNATASDANGDVISYNWEGWDVGAAGSWPSAATSTTRPLFRTRVSKATGERTFPDIRVIAANYPGTAAPSVMNGLRGEVLPAVARQMKFRLTVRDNRANGGGVVSAGEGCQDAATFVVNAVGTTPFAVTSPNGGESFAGGSSQTITWNIAGTDVAPINVANVKISLSTDGGLTYPTVLIASTPNDGTESVTIPSTPSTTARIKVEALAHIFFDISNANFTITGIATGFTFNSPTVTPVSCPAPASMTTAGPLTATFTGGFSNPVTLSATGNPPGTTVTFSNATLTTGSPSSNVTLNNTNTLAAGSYTITVLGSTTGATNQTRDIVFTINAGTGPGITTQPASQTVCVGSNVTFNVAASGSGLSYQWQVSTNGGGTFTNVAGQITASYTISSVAIGLSGNQYRCVVSTLCGSTNSNAAILTVNAAPAITAQPQDLTLCTGNNATFTVTATGGGLAYQWQLSTDGGATYNNISGATAASYTATAITAGMNGNRYRCVVTGTCTPAATSTGAILTVVTSVNVTTQPNSQTICDGSSVTFTVAGSGSGILYQWQISTDGGTTYTNISGATAASYTIAAVTPAMNNNRYRCQLSNPTCTTPGISNAAILTVNTLPAVTTNPADATICVGATNTFTAAGTGTGVAYQWQLSTDGGTTYANISGATTATYTTPAAVIAMNGNRYRCVISGTCTPAVNTTAAILTVIAPVTISTQPANQEVCSGSNTTFTVAGSSVPAIIYQWQVSTDGGTTFTNISGANAATLTLNAVATTANDNRYRCLLSNGTCTVPATSNTARLVVRQLPTVGLAAAPLTSLLPGKSTTLNATPSAATSGTLTITWLKDNNVFTNTGNAYVVNVENVGAYQVRIQEAFTGGITCSNASPVVTIDATASDKLFIFPSPNDGNFTVSYYNAGGASTQRKIAIFDSRGGLVYERLFPITGPYTLIPIKMGNANRGIYYVVVGNSTGTKLADGKVHVR